MTTIISCDDARRDRALGLPSYRGSGACQRRECAHLSPRTPSAACVTLGVACGRALMTSVISCDATAPAKKASRARGWSSTCRMLFVRDMLHCLFTTVSCLAVYKRGARRAAPSKNLAPKIFKPETRARGARVAHYAVTAAAVQAAMSCCLLSRSRMSPVTCHRSPSHARESCQPVTLSAGRTGLAAWIQMSTSW